MRFKFSPLLATVLALNVASSALAQINIPTNLVVRAPFTTGGGNLRGEYWKRPVNSIPTDGATSSTNRIDNLINGFGVPWGTFRATRFVYTGNDLSHVTNWLGADASSFVGLTNNLDDGAFRFRGFINITNAGTVNIGTTSDDGSRITIGGIDVVNNDGSHGDATVDTNVVFAAAGVYPIEITFFNGDWTSDGTGAQLNHSGNPDPLVHGGANFHLRVAGADVTTARAAMFFSDAGSVIIPTNFSISTPRTTGGGNLRGEYWKRPINSIPTDGATNPEHRIDELVDTFGPPDGTFRATRLVYTGNDLSHVTNWLGADAASFVGTTNNLDDGAFRLTGFINVTNAGTIRLGTTSDDGSRITIGGIDVINNDGSHGDVTMDTNVFFTAAGLYPIEITFFNGDWTSDGTGANLNHSGSLDPTVHGGANLHLRVANADVTTAGAAMFFSTGPALFVPGSLAVAPPQSSGGGWLRGEYWKRPINTIPTDGATNPTNRIDDVIETFGPPTGRFQARKLVYTGNDLSNITNWLSTDASSYLGPTNNLDDGAFRFRGYINVPVPGTVNIGTTSDDGSRITIGGIDIINNDSGHGDATVSSNVVFAAAGLYPIEITYFNGDWTSDGTGANLNHSGSLDPTVHGGANFHLLISGADVTSNRVVTTFFPTAPNGSLPSELGQVVHGYQDDFTGATRDPNWQAFGPAGDRYEQADGILYVDTAIGDPNHLLYMKPGYSNDVQEVLARIRVTAFQTNHDYPRGGIAVGVQTNAGEVSRGLNLHFRDSTQDNVPGRQFKFLDDLRAWGPPGLRSNIPPQTTPGWTNNVWYWLRMRLDPKMDGTNTLFAKVWVSDGATPEPANWQLRWSDAAIPKPLRRGFAGLAGSSVDANGNGLGHLEVDYILIKAAGLPEITVDFDRLGPPRTDPTFTEITRLTNNRLQLHWIGAAALEQADIVVGPWTPVPAASQLGLITATNAARFYRLRPLP